MLAFINSYILGPALPVLIFAAGLYFFIILRGFPFSHPVKVTRVFFKKSGSGVSPFKAVCLALAGTLGVGNIVGVSGAMAVGGPGALFWMLVSALFAMLLKYAEITLAMTERHSDRGIARGGAMYYIPNKAVASLFALLCAGASFTLGNFIQVRAAADAVLYAFSVPQIVTGIAFSAVTMLVVCRGVSGITSFTVKLIPLLTVGYVVMSVAVIAVNIDRLPDALRSVIDGAFSFDSAAGGIGGFLLSDALRSGVSRGILSNEAGCGTAPIAHAHAENTPAEQGCWGLFEVFCDTLLLCPLTALAILCSGVEAGGMDSVIAAYESAIGAAAPPLIALSIAMFALATVICWAHYGLEALYFLTKKPLPDRVYKLLYSLCAVLGAVLTADFVWQSADIFVALMTIVNTICVVYMSAPVKRETLRYFSATG